MEIRLPAEPITLSPLIAAELLEAVAGACSATEWWIRILKAIATNHLRHSSVPIQPDSGAVSCDFGGPADLYLHVQDLGEWLKKEGHSVSFETD